MRVSPRGYASLLILSPLLSYPIAVATAYMLLSNSLLALALAALIALVVFLVIYIYPFVKFKNRGETLEIKIINLEMFILSAFLSSPSYSDALIKLYDRRSLIGFDVELEEAARHILSQQGDAAVALERGAAVSPSRSVRILFESLRGLIESGFGVIEYIQWAMNSHYGEVEARYRAALESLSLIMEIFMALAVLGPILVIVGVIALYGLGTSIAPPAFDPRLLVTIVSFVASPAVALWVLIAIDGIISRLR